MALRFRYPPWRALYQHLLEYRGEAWADDVLLPWVEAHPRPVRDLRRIGQPEAMNIAVPNDHDNYTPLQALYVLSRVLDVLIAPFQLEGRHAASAPSSGPSSPASVPSPGSPWPGRVPDRGAYEAFCSALGCVKISQQRFHPFFHEIVAVQPAEDPQEPPSIVTEQWPGFLAGSLLLARAGVTVRAGLAVARSRGSRALGAVLGLVADQSARRRRIPRLGAELAMAHRLPPRLLRERAGLLQRRRGLPGAASPAGGVDHHRAAGTAPLPVRHPPGSRPGPVDVGRQPRRGHRRGRKLVHSGSPTRPGGRARAASARRSRA